MEFIACNTANYRAGRTQPVRYIVMHYTANNGDTARNNCDYYHRVGGLQASAHYFCDEYGAMQSVREGDTAWHCGARAYWHPECRNANSIGIEMCSRKRADGSYYIKPETVANAAALAREIMQRYGIDTEHVVRHYDVTGKRCPMPWVDDPAQWTAFKDMLKQNDNDEEDENMVKYKTIDDVPEWYRSEVQELMDAGALKGTGNGAIDISEDVVRGAIIGMRYVEAKNPHYHSIDDMPEYYRKEAQKLVDRGALRGVGGGDLNVSADALRSMIVCQRMIDENK
jgi:N-acetyl-anhydromuramyl-L-alanine amidase AmpD